MAVLKTTYTTSDLGVFGSILGPSSLSETSAINRSSSQFTAAFPGGASRLEVTGSGFSFKDGFVSKGTISSVNVVVDGALMFTITDLHLNAATLYNWVKNYDFANPTPSPIFAGNDIITGGSAPDRFDGGQGHDVMIGGDGNDELSGGDGNDHIYGQSANGGPDGDDGLDGGAGSDYVQGNAGNDRLNGGAGSDRIFGGAGNDSISGDYGLLNLHGNDSVNGNLGNDTINGAGGNDLLRGGQGDDKLIGDSGSDTLIGDKGDDRLLGGEDSDPDWLTGGEGHDIFYLRGQTYSGPQGLFAHVAASFTTTGPQAYVIDTVTDFTVGEDSIGIGSEGGPISVGSANDIVSAALLAEQLLPGGNAALAAIEVGNDTYVFMKSFSDHVNAGIRLLDVSADELAASNDALARVFDF